MINLLLDKPSRSAITSILQTSLRRPLMPAMNQPEWHDVKANSIVQRWAVPLLEKARADRDVPLPALPDELYALFFKTGERLPFESVYFERRRRLGRAAMACLVATDEERPAFQASLVAKLEETMAEVSWTFPAHAWTEPTGKDPFKIDLFSAETANVMGEALDIFGAILPEDLKGRIRTRLHEQYFENYLRPRSEITWKKLPMNWNAVCHQGVIGAALAVEDDIDLLAEMLASTADCLGIFLGGFGADGSTSEGPGYWTYGFGRFAELNQQLETATNGALSLFSGDERVRRIAEFAPGLVLSNGRLVNFSDGHHKGRLGASLLAYLGERLEMPVLLEESRYLYAISAEEGIDWDGQRCDLFHLSRWFLRCPSSIETVAEPVRPDLFFPDYGAVVARGVTAGGRLLEFAAKGGHNEEHHNHNDCGSFLLNVDGESVVTEIGAPEYVRAFFSAEERYTFLAARSLGHSVPYVNGCEQNAGASFCATVVDCELGATRTLFSVDLTKAYPEEAALKTLKRTFEFDKQAGSLSVVDEFAFETAGSFESILITQGNVSETSEGVRLSTPGGDALIRLAGGDGVFLGVEECEYRTHQGKASSIRRLRFGPSGNVPAGQVSYVISLA